MEWKDQWDFVDLFTIEQVEMLITGDTQESMFEKSFMGALIAKSPVRVRLENALNKGYRYFIKNETPSSEDYICSPTFIRRSRGVIDGSPISIPRMEMVRWLASTRLKSAYNFDLDAPANDSPVTTAPTTPDAVPETKVEAPANDSPVTTTPTTPDTVPETIAQRNARWLAEYDEEASRFDKRGAVARVFEREKARNPDAPSRSTISRAILKERARIAREKQGAAWLGRSQ